MVFYASVSSETWTYCCCHPLFQWHWAPLGCDRQSMLSVNCTGSKLSSRPEKRLWPMYDCRSYSQASVCAYCYCFHHLCWHWNPEVSFQHSMLFHQCYLKQSEWSSTRAAACLAMQTSRRSKSRHSDSSMSSGASSHAYSSYRSQCSCSNRQTVRFPQHRESPF